MEAPAMTTKALVGPLPTVHFRDGTAIAADPPRSTTDPRWLACTKHRTACWCREAELSEEAGEYRAMYHDARAASARILAGHPTYEWRQDPATGQWADVSCQCTGCQLAREAGLPGGEVR
jgi:hypothetical protein